VPGAVGVSLQLRYGQYVARQAVAGLVSDKDEDPLLLAVEQFLWLSKELEMKYYQV
jgi:hypothetical protein